MRRRTLTDVAAQFGKSLSYLGIVKTAVYLAIQQIDDVDRSIPGCAHAKPSARARNPAKISETVGRFWKCCERVADVTANGRSLPSCTCRRAAAVIMTCTCPESRSVWANNPAIVGYVEAMKISKECNRPDIDPRFTHKDISLLSIGTGTRRHFSRPNDGDAGLRWWGPRLLSISGETQSEGIHFQAQYLLGDSYTRVDFEIPEGKWDLDSVEKS